MNYETTFICSPDLPPEKVEELSKKLEKIIENSKGAVKTIHQPVKKKLAYPVQKFREGSYVFVELSGDGIVVNAMENFFRVTDGIIRYLTVKVEKKKIAAVPVAPVTPAAEPAMEVKNEPTNQQSTEPTLA
jgi:small subunit ribosomal protein S6